MTTKIRLLHDTVGIPTGAVAVTQSASDNTTKVATTAYVTTALANLADSAPSTLNTLNELAAALGDDANFSTTVTNSIAAKLPLAGGTMTGTLKTPNLTINDGVQEFDKPNVKGFRFLHNDAGNDLSIQQGDTNNANYVTKLNISTDGKVGIGTSSPSRELELKATTPRFRITDTDGGYSEISGSGGHLSFSADAGNTQGGSRITFDIDGSEHMRLASSGNVGIGTSSPRRQMHIHNSASATVGLMLTNGNTGESNDSQGFQFKVGSDSHAEISQMENSDLRIFTNASEKMRIGSDGAVTIKPTGITTGLRLQGRSSDNNFFVQWNSNDGSTNYGSIGSNNSGRLDYGANTHHFTNQATNNTYMAINSTGVGIGTTGHSNKFGVKVTSINTNERLINLYTGTTGPGKYVSIGAQYSETNLLSNSEIRFGNEVQSNAPSFLAFATGNTTTPPERMRIDSDGNVGIGATSSIYSGTNVTSLTINASSYPVLALQAGGSNYGIINATSSYLNVGTIGTRDIIFTPNDTERMRIDSSGTVYIGPNGNTADPRITRHANGYDYLNSGNNRWLKVGASSGHTNVAFQDGASGVTIFETGGAEMMRIDTDYVVPKMNFHYSNSNTGDTGSTTANEINSGAGVLMLKQQITVRAGSKIIVWCDSGQITQASSGAYNPQMAIYIDSHASTPSRGPNHRINQDGDHRWYPGDTNNARIFLTAMGSKNISTAGTYYIYVYGGSYNAGTFTFNAQGASRGCSIVWTEVMQ